VSGGQGNQLMGGTAPGNVPSKLCMCADCARAQRSSDERTQENLERT